MASTEPLNVLMVVHQFLPRHVAGTEIYTFHLASELRNQGHRVTLFFTEIRPDRPQYDMRRGEFRGLPYYEAVQNHRFPSFRHTYRDVRMESLFATVLEEVRPDVLHIQHLYLHSIGYIELARRRGLPIVYTLHDYLLMCLNRGLLLQPDMGICAGPSAAACAQCAEHIYPQRRSPMQVLRRSLGLLERLDDAVRLRMEDVDAQLRQVDLFIAPSRFLRQRFVDEQLVSADRIVHADYGFAGERMARRARRRETIRAGYVGTISEFNPDFRFGCGTLTV